jgi:hypothetical protein
MLSCVRRCAIGRFAKMAADSEKMTARRRVTKFLFTTTGPERVGPGRRVMNIFFAT